MTRFFCRPEYPGINLVQDEYRERSLVVEMIRDVHGCCVRKTGRVRCSEAHTSLLRLDFSFFSLSLVCVSSFFLSSSLPDRRSMREIPSGGQSRASSSRNGGEFSNSQSGRGFISAQIFHWPGEGILSSGRCEAAPRGPLGGCALWHILVASHVCTHICSATYITVYTLYKAYTRLLSIGGFYFTCSSYFPAHRQNLLPLLLRLLLFFSFIPSIILSFLVCLFHPHIQATLSQITFAPAEQIDAAKLTRCSIFASRIVARTCLHERCVSYVFFQRYSFARFPSR